MSETPLGPGAEFDVIRRLLAGAEPPGERVALGPGDDCALLRCGDGYLALSVDLFVESAHFRREWGTAESIGRRAVSSAVSDLAAMAAQPLAVLVALNVPQADDAELAERIGLGCRERAGELGTDLIGGDLSRGGDGLALDVTAVGSVREPLLRGAVRPGCGLWVTGTLGAAAAAVRAWKAGASVPGEWRERFWNPEPRIREARWLAERGVAAGIDLSDGLLADAGHLAAASGVGIEIDAETVPVARDVAPELALGGGEDYELLVAAPDDILGTDSVAEFQQLFGFPLTRVGRAVVGAGVRVFRDGAEERPATLGFDHFGGT